MVLSKETNMVYLSELLKVEYPKECDCLTDILERQNIDYDFLLDTKSVWCRDYMPIQTATNRFVQFKYKPSYIDNNTLISDGAKVCKQLGIEPILSDIVLDGGNVTGWNGKVVITDRVFDENTQYSSRTKLVSQLEKELEAEVIVIPQIKSSQRGHVDSLLRFFDKDTLIGNNRFEEYSYWSRDLNNILQDYQLSYIDLPFFHFNDEDYWYNDLGSYINFLEIDNLIIMPIFETDQNRDKEAAEVLQKHYPDRAIETLNINDVAFDGGILNSVTWTIKR